MADSFINADGSDQAIVIAGDRVPVAAYQAIYHKLTGKTEKLSELFPDAYSIKLSDLIQLNELIEQSIFQYRVSGKRCEVILSLKKGQGFQFSSFEKFSQFNHEVNRCTSRLNVEYDFFTVLPSEVAQANEIVQRFKLVVGMDQDFVEEDESNVPTFMKTVMTGNI